MISNILIHANNTSFLKLVNYISNLNLYLIKITYMNIMNLIKDHITI